jgi:IclR family transcriptional regulator, pca regulon regulatory protein
VLDSPEGSYSQSLERGLAILRCFTPTRPVLGINDVAGELGMTPSTTHRYMHTLVMLGYLDRAKNHKYRLGLSVTDLGMSALSSTSLREHAHIYLEDLRRQTSFAIGLGVLAGKDVLYLDRLRSFRRGRENDIEIRTGSRMPAYCTAMGKLLLAHLPELEQRKLIAKMRLKKHTPHTITSKAALRKDLDQIHANDDIAIDDEELSHELYAVAAPVRDETGEVVAAVDMTTPASITSLNSLLQQTPHLLSTADHISTRLGYRHSNE